VNEILGLRMVSVHNSHMYLKLMADTRAHLADGTFAEFRREFVATYVPTRRVLAGAHSRSGRIRNEERGTRNSPRLSAVLKRTQSERWRAHERSVPEHAKRMECVRFHRRLAG